MGKCVRTYVASKQISQQKLTKTLQDIYCRRGVSSVRFEAKIISPFLVLLCVVWFCSQRHFNNLQVRGESSQKLMKTPRRKFTLMSKQNEERPSCWQKHLFVSSVE